MGVQTWKVGGVADASPGFFQNSRLAASAQIRLQGLSKGRTDPALL